MRDAVESHNLLLNQPCAAISRNKVRIVTMLFAFIALVRYPYGSAIHAVLYPLSKSIQ